jgi:hypothetical protein
MSTVQVGVYSLLEPHQKLQYKVTVSAKIPTTLEGTPAIVTYRTSSSNKVHSLLSSAWSKPVTVHSTEKFAKLTDKHLVEYGFFAVAFMLTSVFPSVLLIRDYFLFTHGVPNSLAKIKTQ